MKAKTRREHKSAGVIQKTALRAGQSNLDCSYPPPGRCTRDINECGNPSNCDCGVNTRDYAYNPASGNCEKLGV